MKPLLTFILLFTSIPIIHAQHAFIGLDLASIQPFSCTCLPITYTRIPEGSQSDLNRRHGNLEGPWELAGGTILSLSKMQLTEYGLGLTGQLRYRFGPYPNDRFANRMFALISDISIYPLRQAQPGGDRPYRWSSLRDSLDQSTGHALSWHRGSRRSTASLGLGIEVAPLPWLYVQAMWGIEATFRQSEFSSPDKDLADQFEGFDQNVPFWSGRIGIRSGIVEIFLSSLASRINRPFTFVPANPLGGSQDINWDIVMSSGVLFRF